MKTETPFFSVPTTLITIGIFAITIIGVATWVGESTRITKWKKVLKWLPNDRTVIIDLPRNRLAKFNMRGSCYIYRTYPPKIGVTVYRAPDNLKQRSVVPTNQLIPDGNSKDTTNYPYRWFVLDRSGTLFIDTRHSNNRAACERLFRSIQ